MSKALKKNIRKTIISVLLTGIIFTGVVNGIEKKLPENVEVALDEIIFAGKTNANAVVSNKNLKLLSDFIISAADNKNVWKVKSRRNAAGAVLIKSYKIPVEKVLKMNLNANIPDAALFYNVLRYSKKINLSPECKKFIVDISKRINTNKVFETSYLSVEGITPNVQSGSYYSYTNLRTITRANINGKEMLISISDMIAPSALSMRGVPVGPVEDGVFYYSQKLGMNMTGVTWLKSQMYLSSTIAVYMETPDGGTAVAMFSWQSAGWRGMNVIKSHHIYNVLQDTFRTFENVFGNPKVNSKKILEIIEKINAMNPKEKNLLYGKYCDYVKTWCNKKPPGLNPFRKSDIKKIFSEKSLINMKQEYKDILIIQELIRHLIGKSTWLAKKSVKVVGIDN